MNIVAAINHQIKATLKLIANGCKQYILQLLDLEAKLEALATTTNTTTNTTTTKTTPETLISRLQGSEKQIKWAKDIITRCYWNHPQWEKLTHHFNRQQAGWWIDNRYILAEGNIPVQKLNATQYMAIRLMSNIH